MEDSLRRHAEHRAAAGRTYVDDSNGDISGVEDALRRFGRRGVESFHAVVPRPRRPACVPARLNLRTAESAAQCIGSDQLLENVSIVSNIP